MKAELVLDAAEAPDGFHAVPKAGINRVEKDNICRYCDARDLCQQDKDSWCRGNPCMGYARRDGVGVVFKKS
jgi:hypothetical protein